MSGWLKTMGPRRPSRTNLSPARRFTIRLAVIVALTGVIESLAGGRNLLGGAALGVAIVLTAERSLAVSHRPRRAEHPGAQTEAAVSTVDLGRTWQSRIWVLRTDIDKSLGSQEHYEQVLQPLLLRLVAFRHRAPAGFREARNEKSAPTGESAALLDRLSQDPRPSLPELERIVKEVQQL